MLIIASPENRRFLPVERRCMTTIDEVAERIEDANDDELLYWQVALAEVSGELLERASAASERYIVSKCRKYLEQIDSLQTSIDDCFHLPTFD